MSAIRARVGNTELLLLHGELRVSIAGEVLGQFALTARDVQELWSQVSALSVPLVLGEGTMGVGGTSTEIEIRRGATHLAMAWWMSAPPGWDGVAGIFTLLSRHLPRDITARYDFARGGE